MAPDGDVFRAFVFAEIHGPGCRERLPPIGQGAVDRSRALVVRHPDGDLGALAGRRDQVAQHVQRLLGLPLLDQGASQMLQDHRIVRSFHTDPLLQQLAGQFQGTLFGIYDLFTGGALQRATVFALGIMPYITASIIMQVLGVVIPKLEELQNEGAVGQRKITQYTRYGTLALATFQAIGISVALQGQFGEGLVVTSGPGFVFTATVSRMAS